MIRNSLIFFLICLIFASCKDNPVPKPKGYFRIDLPEKSYSPYHNMCPFSFEIPNYSSVELRKDLPADSCWFNLGFPSLHAKIHFTYLPVHNNLDQYFEEAYQFAFKHEMKANAIERTTIENPENQVYGLTYDIKGNVASSYQFYLSDNQHHFLRGALYFNNLPNADSLAPVLAFIKEDVDHMISTFKWKNDSMP